MHWFRCVVAVSFTLVGTVRAAETVPDVLIEILRDYERYAESVWHDAPAPPNSGYFGDGRSGGNGGIRGMCGTALAYAVLLNEFPNDGDSKRRLARVEAVLRYASGTHKVWKHAQCIDGKNWGYSWQSSLWTGSMGFACALVQDRLPADLVRDCHWVVATEADRLAKTSPPSGNRGDSKAEENAWNSNAMALAAAWVPGSRRDQWLAGAKRYLVNTYTVPDPGDDPLREWITTVNLLPSYTMENHGFFHPTYQMVSGMSLGDSLLMAQRLSPATAKELTAFAEHNVRPVWQSLENVLLDSGELGYPSGLDWSLHGYGQVSYYAWLATHFQDGEAHWACQRLVRLARARQKVNGDGRFTGESCANGFYREAVMARRAAIALLHYRQAKQLPKPVAPSPSIIHMPDVKLILQRSPEGFTGISYGSRIMAVVHPTAIGHEDAPYVTTPMSPGLLTLNGNLPRDAEISDVTTTEDGFSCTLDLSDRFLSVSRMRVVGTGDSLAFLEVPGGAAPDKLPLVFPVGIENHALTGKSRLIRSSAGDLHVPERSGARHELPLAVSASDRFGMVAGPDGKLVYQAANRYNRSGAAEDTLAFQPSDARKARFAILLPNADLLAVQRVQQTVEFKEADGVATLSYRTPGGKAVELNLASTVPVAPYSRLDVPCKVVVANHHQKYPGTNMVDGDPATFWVSSKDGVAVVPGHGPTPESPERVEMTFPESRVGGIMIAPRVRYGPRRLTVTLGGKEVFSGTMGQKPLLIPCKEPVEAESLVLTITQSHDPAHPTNTRNVQIAEIALLKAK